LPEVRRAFGFAAYLNLDEADLSSNAAGRVSEFRGQDEIPMSADIIEIEDTIHE